MKRFLIVGPHRSGTTLVHLTLRSHPQVSSPKDEVKVVPLFESGISAFTYGHETEDEHRVGFTRAFDMLAAISLIVGILAGSEACVRFKMRSIDDRRTGLGAT